MTPGTRLKAALKAAGLTQTAFGARLGVQPKIVSDVVRGRRPIPQAWYGVVYEATGLLPWEVDPSLCPVPYTVLKRGEIGVTMRFYRPPATSHV